MPSSPPKTSLHVRLAPEDHEWIRRTAFTSKQSMAAVIRQAVEEMKARKEASS